MAEYIEREAAIEAITRVKEEISGEKDIERIVGAGAYLLDIGAREAINSIPAADVRPVARGEWEPTDLPNRPFPKWFQCSNCKTIFGAGITGAIAPEYGNRTWNYCPNCGADMRPEPKEED